MTATKWLVSLKSVWDLLWDDAIFCLGVSDKS